MTTYDAFLELINPSLAKGPAVTLVATIHIHDFRELLRIGGTKYSELNFQTIKILNPHLNSSSKINSGGSVVESSPTKWEAWVRLPAGAQGQ